MTSLVRSQLQASLIATAPEDIRVAERQPPLAEEIARMREFRILSRKWRRQRRDEKREKER